MVDTGMKRSPHALYMANQPFPSFTVNTYKYDFGVCQVCPFALHQNYTDALGFKEPLCLKLKRKFPMYISEPTTTQASHCFDSSGDCSLLNKTISICSSPQNARKLCPEFCGLCSIGKLSSHVMCTGQMLQ